MDKKEKKYNLHFFNENIRIVSNEGDEYIQELYEYIMTVMDGLEDMPYITKALYACVLLADELLKEKRKGKR
jgi:hypothetical protein